MIRKASAASGNRGLVGRRTPPGHFDVHFPQADARKPAFDDLEAAVAASLEESNGLTDAESLRRALIGGNTSLGVDQAKYCLAKACADVLNPEEIRTAIRRHFGG